MNSLQYLHLRPVGIESCDAAKSDQELINEGWWCGTCRKPKPQMDPINFQIAEAKPPNTPLSSAAFFGVALAQRNFLSLLGEDNVARDLILGKVYNGAGKDLGDWATVRGKHKITVRGSLKQGFEHLVGYRNCEACGQLSYSAYPPNYLYPRPSEGAMILQSDLNGLIVSTKLGEILNLKSTRRFAIETLNVLDNPIDGLGDLVD